METPGSLGLVRRIRHAAPKVKVALAVPDEENSVVACAEAASYARSGVMSSTPAGRLWANGNP
jgi:hypothetical protein